MNQSITYQQVVKVQRKKQVVDTVCSAQVDAHGGLVVHYDDRGTTRTLTLNHEEAKQFIHDLKHRMDLFELMKSQGAT